MFESMETGVSEEFESRIVRQVLGAGVSIPIMFYFHTRVADMFDIVFGSKELSLAYIIARPTFDSI